MRIQAETEGVEDEAERAAKEAAIRQDIERMKQEALAAGGLMVIGTERHESRRIDNQLRGRSGRQGDPGRSQFFLSLQDDLMRIFGSNRMDGMLTKLGLKDDEAIIHPWINKALERAQGKVEAHNFDIRKNLLKYDNVMNDQRKVIFEQRIELMTEENVAETVRDMRQEVVDQLVARFIPERAYPEQWDTTGLAEAVRTQLGLELPVADWAKEEGIADDEIRERITKASDEHMARKAARFGPDLMRAVEKQVLLQTLDHLWREHLATLDHLRSVVGFRGYAQRDPLNEYKTEGFELFQTLLASLRTAVITQLAHVEVQQRPADPAPMFGEAHHIDPLTGEDEMTAFTVPDRVQPGRDPANPSTWGKVGRNESCPCGSGKKFKQCHGVLAA
jgi:preprotein translocase subunit SecA